MGHGQGKARQGKARHGYGHGHGHGVGMGRLGKWHVLMWSPRLALMPAINHNDIIASTREYRHIQPISNIDANNTLTNKHLH